MRWISVATAVIWLSKCEAFAEMQNCRWLIHTQSVYHFSWCFWTAQPWNGIMSGDLNQRSDHLVGSQRCVCLVPHDSFITCNWIMGKFGFLMGDVGCFCILYFVKFIGRFLIRIFVFRRQMPWKVSDIFPQILWRVPCLCLYYKIQGGPKGGIQYLYYTIYYILGTAVAQWLRCWSTNRKVAGSIPGGVIAIFHWHNPSDRTMALGSTQPLIEISIRSIS